MPEKPCDPRIRAGRLEKATQFRLAAEVIEEYAEGDDDLNDSYITLCVHAGIAAADVICCKQLNVHNVGDNHDGAVAVLARVDPALANDLARLLRKKTHSAYSALTSSAKDRVQAERVMTRLVDAAVEYNAR